MSTPQRTHARMLVVDRETADVLRRETKKMMDLGHELFEDFLLYGPEAQYVLAMRFCAATQLITAVGWDPDKDDPNTESFEVPLTDDLIEQLRHRRYDLALCNNDRLDGLPIDKPIDAGLLAEITVDRLAAQALDRLFTTYIKATKN
jgi:TolB-like protein